MELELKSDKIYLDIDKPESLITAEIDGVSISEIYNPNERYHGEYQLVLKIDITKSDELGDGFAKLEKIASLINRLTTYIVGQPLNFKSNSFYGSRMSITQINSIDGWSSNYTEVKEVLENEENEKNKNEGFRVEISTTGVIHWSTTENPPLTELITIYSRYKGLDEITKLLILFHNKALLHNDDIKYLILGKALELAKTLLPHKTHEENFDSLPQEIKDIFTKKSRTIRWLYDTANNRIETRHIVQRGTSELHPEMSDEEYFDYMYLADTLINYLVRLQFELEPIIAIHK